MINVYSWRRVNTRAVSEGLDSGVVARLGFRFVPRIMTMQSCASIFSFSVNRWRPVPLGEHHQRRRRTSALHAGASVPSCRKVQVTARGGGRMASVITNVMASYQLHSMHLNEAFDWTVTVNMSRPSDC